MEINLQAADIETRATVEVVEMSVPPENVAVELKIEDIVIALPMNPPATGPPEVAYSWPDLLQNLSPHYLSPM